MPGTPPWSPARCTAWGCKAVAGTARGRAACTYDTLGGQHIWFSGTDPASRHMPGFRRDWNSSDPGSASGDWIADAQQRAMLGKVRDRGANLFELFSNSPMWWMCRDYTPEGYYDGSENLQSWNHRQHAAISGPNWTVVG